MKKNWSLGIGHWALEKRGFSLIELIFAMFFLIIIIFGVMNLQTSNLIMMSRQNNEIQANLLANQALEIMDAVGYTMVHGAYTDCGVPPCERKIFDDEGSPPTYSLPTGAPEVIGSLPFNRTVDITPLANPNAYKVTASVEWEDASGIHTVSVKRIIYQ